MFKSVYYYEYQYQINGETFSGCGNMDVPFFAWPSVDTLRRKIANHLLVAQKIIIIKKIERLEI